MDDFGSPGVYDCVVTFVYALSAGVTVLSGVINAANVDVVDASINET